jgi:hypothetical protein
VRRDGSARGRSEAVQPVLSIIKQTPSTNDRFLYPQELLIEAFGEEENIKAHYVRTSRQCCSRRGAHSLKSVRLLSNLIPPKANRALLGMLRRGEVPAGWPPIRPGQFIWKSDIGECHMAVDTASRCESFFASMLTFQTIFPYRGRFVIVS